MSEIENVKSMDSLLQHAFAREDEWITMYYAARDKRDLYRAALEECLEKLRDEQDVIDGPDGEPQPDWVMRLANMVDETLHGIPY